MSGSEKIMDDPQRLAAWLSSQRDCGRRIVLTNGAFDLLHVGHVRCLEEARGLGDLLLVAVNSDASVRASKGPLRPLVPQAERAEILAALACVDAVTFFSEQTADTILRLVRPAIYAKGRDYDLQTLPEAATAREVGARVCLVGDQKTHGTSDLAARLRHQERPDHEA